VTVCTRHPVPSGRLAVEEYIIISLIVVITEGGLTTSFNFVWRSSLLCARSPNIGGHHDAQGLTVAYTIDISSFVLQEAIKVGQPHISTVTLASVATTFSVILRSCFISFRKMLYHAIFADYTVMLINSLLPVVENMIPRLQLGRFDWLWLEDYTVQKHCDDELPCHVYNAEE
jgi:hypothetical protein